MASCNTIMDSTYDSIICKYNAQWAKLNDDEALAQLHRKFWSHEPENKPLNIHDPEDIEEGEDNEIGPGCYVLDIGIPNIGLSKLWVRKEYIRLYKRCNDFLEAHRNKQEFPSVVITGQPGIGKSYWVIYALCRRLAEGKPVIWFHSQLRYLFVDEGVFVEPQRYYPATDFKTGIWTLVDSDEDNGAIPCHLAVHDTKHLLIYSSYPKSDRWKALGRTTLGVVAVMNPWTREEISRAAPIHGFTASDPRIDDMYYRLGPTPRICFDFLKDNDLLTMHEGRCEKALQEMSSQTLCDMVSGASEFKMDVISHTILLVKRVDVSGRTSWTRESVEPITHAVEMALRNQLEMETRDEQLKLYNYLVKVEGMRHLAGVVDEQLAQPK